MNENPSAPSPPTPVGGEGWGEEAARRISETPRFSRAAPSPNPLPHRARWGRGLKHAAAIFLTIGGCVAQATPSQDSRVIDDFENTTLWKVQHTDDVSASIKSADGHIGKALHLDFDFNDVNGYATAHRDVPLDLPENYELSFWIRGAAPVNNLQFKLIDASGENVWWLNNPDFTFQKDWQEIRVRKRDIEFAWGPTKDRELHHSASIEFVVSSGRDGGKGSVEFDHLTLRELPPRDTSPLSAKVSATTSLKGWPASAAMDGDIGTAWRSDATKTQYVDLDFGKPREVGGIVLHWRHSERAKDYQLRQSADGKHWFSCVGSNANDGDVDFQVLCGDDIRYLRIELRASESSVYGLSEIEIKDIDWGKTSNTFFQNVAKVVPRGRYPRGFVEQVYWTLVGVDGGGTPALISEDGALEPRKGLYSIEPFVVVDAKRLSWANVTSTQSLLDDSLPMPSVEWKSEKIALRIDAFARGTRDAPQLVARYRLRNTTDKALDATLQLAVRPFQVNPPTQFLNSAGGVGSIRSMAWNGSTLKIDDDILTPLVAPDHFESLAIDGSPFATRLDAKTSDIAYSEFGNVSGALVYKFHLQPRGEEEVDLVAPIAGAPPAPVLANTSGKIWSDAEQQKIAQEWRARLGRVTISGPPEAKHLVDTLRTALAHILLTRDGPSLRPGTRSYARSWIRDGSMIADALLRLGEIDAVREYVDWYVPYQFANGKVPCCVDHRGSDPVPENDSHGELIHAIAQLYRYTGDKAELARHWPHVASAIAYMDALRASETGATDPAFKGLMPASISHEGYSAKPMHSYWDDFWALTGYKDAASIAGALGRSDDESRIAAARDVFRTNLYSSIELATKSRGIDYIPGSAELGDFDATSTTIALSPAGEQANLPQAKLRATFDRYWNGFVDRRDGSKQWEDYTPYEWRVVGAFVRLGQRERALAASDFFFQTGARPAGWNQWAEVVGQDSRKPRFIGDMPHGWVASDFIRSTLDRFAYERDDTHVIVIAAGVPSTWLDGAGVAIEHLRTAYGNLSYRVRRTQAGIAIHLDVEEMPPGGFVFTWPGSKPPGTTLVKDKAAIWKDGELHVVRPHVDVLISE
jgi:F5/8 type C domain/Carbohydrate binding domain (family 11)